MFEWNLSAYETMWSFAFLIRSSCVWNDEADWNDWDGWDDWIWNFEMIY